MSVHAAMSLSEGNSDKRLFIFVMIVKVFVSFGSSDVSLIVFQDKEGGFIVRESSQKGVYTVSVYTKTIR